MNGSCGFTRTPNSVPEPAWRVSCTGWRDNTSLAQRDMGDISRRTFVASALGCAATAAARAGRRTQFKIGVPDWSLALGANPDAVGLAKKLGFDGVQISFGRLLVNGKLPLDNPDLIAHYLQLSAQNNIPINGTCVDRLHMDLLKSDKAAVRWVSDSIRLTKALNTQVLLLPFFGR